MQQDYRNTITIESNVEIVIFIQSFSIFIQINGDDVIDYERTNHSQLE